jgi:hypothetical protein
MVKSGLKFFITKQEGPKKFLATPKMAFFTAASSEKKASFLVQQEQFLVLLIL